MPVIIIPAERAPSIESRPPTECCQVKNIYWDPKVDRVAIEYDNKLVPKEEVNDGY